MLALIKKDLFCVRSYLFKQYTFMILFFTAFSIYTKSTSLLVGMLGMISFVAVTTGISFDEASGFNKYARCMPVTTKQIVGAKYLLMLAGLLAGSFICMTVGSVISMINAIPFAEHALSCIVVFLIFLFTASINTPVMIKFGVEKSRIYMTLSYIIPFMIGTFGFSILQEFNVPLPSESDILLIAIAAAVFILLCFAASFFISVKLMDNKEL